MTTPWQPLVTDPTSARGLIAVIGEIPTAIEPEQTAKSFADVAVFRAYVADIVPDPDDVSGDALSQSVMLFGKIGGGLGLFGGAARIGWTVAHLADGETADQVCSSIDRVMLGQITPTWAYQYDLIPGLVGFGICALERGDAGRPLAMRVLELLEQRAEPRGPGLASFTAPDLLPAWQQEQAPQGYWNLGLAHGVPGVIGILRGSTPRE